MGNVQFLILYCNVVICDDEYSNSICETRLDIPETNIASTFTVLITWVLTLALDQSPGLRYPMIALASKRTYAITNIATKIGGTPMSINR